MESRLKMLLGGSIIGVIGALMVYFGNPINMGLCVACFIRDTAGALGLHRAAVVQYIRPELIGIVLGSTLFAVARKEFKPTGGSAPLTRFFLGFFIMIGCLVFLGCTFRMILRIAGGDLNALVGLLGFIVGIVVGVFFLKRGYSLKRSYPMSMSEGAIYPIFQVVLFILLVTAPAFIWYSQKGPGATHAAVGVSLVAGLLVGAIAQRLRFCTVGGIRDFILFREKTLLIGFIAITVAALVTNIILTQISGVVYFNPTFENPPIAHVDGVWNFLSMLLVGFACTLIGGCPFRQLVLAGEGNTDSAITLLGVLVGGGFAHNFSLASSAAGPTMGGKVAVVIGLVVVTIIAVLNSRRRI